MDKSISIFQNLKNTFFLGVFFAASLCTINTTYACHHDLDETKNTDTKETSEGDFASLRTEAPKGAAVYFVSPKAGETVSETFTISFGLKGMGVAPAGVENPQTGHHHLLINLKELPKMDAPLPATDNIKHFGGGQTETTLTLPKGTHTLQLLLGNHLHIPHNPPVLSEKMTVTVE